MKVYRIKADVNRYQWLIPDVSDSKTLEYVFDCRPRKAMWQPPEVYSFNPLEESGDFFNFGTGCLLAADTCAERVRTFFEMSGELLPVYFTGKEFILLNVLECVNALNVNKLEKTADGWITKFSFYDGRFSESSIFKVPETRSVDVLTWERDGDPETEFKAFVESTNLTGLTFEELWDSEIGDFA